MFYLSYLFSELRRRKGRTLLTALGLDEAQDKVLEPLTGVGTDMSVVEGSVFTLRLPSAGVEGTDELRIKGKLEGAVATSEGENEAGVRSSWQ